MRNLPELASAHQPNPSVPDVGDPRCRTLEQDRGQRGAGIGQVRQVRTCIRRNLGHRTRETACRVGRQRRSGDIVPVAEPVGDGDQFRRD